MDARVSLEEDVVGQLDRSSITNFHVLILTCADVRGHTHGVAMGMDVRHTMTAITSAGLSRDRY